MASERKDPLAAFCFKVTLSLGDATADAFFKSVSGLRYQTEVIPVREGGANDTTFMLPGSTKWDPIILKQGFTGSSKLLQWREEWISGSQYRRLGGTIQQLDLKQLTTMAKWSFFAGWPSKWEMSEFDASKSELSIETLEITHHGLKFG